VDVGGSRKGFDVAVIDGDGHLETRSKLRLPETIAWLRERRPRVVGIDSPSTAAPGAERSRECERRLARSICGIRYTPNLATLHTEHRTRYYEWINNGLGLYEALNGWTVIEVFPTASWTRWAGPRPRGTSRAAWTRAALEQLGLSPPQASSQDIRDAIAAALTARLYPHATESFGEIVVPAMPST
jgi:predicted nuclease with RNAse H fold